MPRPGVDVTISDPTNVGGGGAALDTGQFFAVGLSQRGPTDAAVRLRSLREYERRFGPRTGGRLAHDAARGYFAERGGTLHFVRLAGPTAHEAQAEVGPLKVSASSPGTWANAVSVGLEAEGGLAGAALPLVAAVRHPNRRKAKGAEGAAPLANGNGNGGAPVPVRVTVTEDGRAIERSQPLTTADEAISWALRSNFVSIDADDPEATLDVTAAVELAGGADDVNVTPQIVGAAFDRFGYALGPGQYGYPGATDYGTHVVILDRAARSKRCALLDLADDDATTLAADAMALYGAAGARFAAALAPRLVYPGAAPGTESLMPYSAVQAGIIARQDAITGNPNESVAGVNGISLNARGLSRDYSDDEREQLNEIGVTLAKVRFDTVRTYGSRTVAGPDEPNWTWFGNSRVVMAIAFEADFAAEAFVHRQIDGQRHLFNELATALGGICLKYWVMGALFGDTPDEAFAVITDESVNTIDTIAEGEVNAAILLRASPPGEWVRIDIQKRPLAMAV